LTLLRPVSDRAIFLPVPRKLPLRGWFLLALEIELQDAQGLADQIRKRFAGFLLKTTTPRVGLQIDSGEKTYGWFAWGSHLIAPVSYQHNARSLSVG
jgi:hypothetical protein